ncbi:macrophage colony-stimulating factor 1b isoform X1 [Megalops cyprinoides]|uniref:macrophage colony-stimulating factor 1b isoform X1 n=1 Tax=Megalops cyprinoides TaxID=118141 RepID=UPI001864F2E3|nr:macrophage colony-stimulating factor 1b isoform X1 [Megalops cyprinoides]
MTRHESAQILCKAKVRGLCFLLLLYFHPGVADVPGTCRHSMRKDHLVTIRRLIDNQLQNGCSITYTFTQQGGLSKACYVKAALPQVLELLSTHFGYAGGSDNGRYVQALKELLHNVYSQKCIPALNEELEDDPVKFSKVYSSSPREALEKAQQVLSFYVELMTMNDMPVNWNCEEEYGETYPEFTTAPTQPTGTAGCQCPSHTVDYGASEQVSTATSSLWIALSDPATPPSPSSYTPGRTSAGLGTLKQSDSHRSTEVTVSDTTPGTSAGKEELGGVTVSSAVSTPAGLFASNPSPGYSSASSDKEGDFPLATSTHLSGQEPNLASTSPDTLGSADSTPLPDVTMESVQVEDFSVDRAEVEDRGPAETVSVFTQILGETGGSVSGTATRHSSLGPHRATISSQVLTGHAPVPLQDHADDASKRPVVGASGPLAKRSVDPRLYKPHSHSGADAQSGIFDDSRLLSSRPPETAEESTTRKNVLEDLSDLVMTPPVSGPTAESSSHTPKTWLREVASSLSRMDDHSRGPPGEDKLLAPTLHLSPSPVPQHETVSKDIADEVAIISERPAYRRAAPGSSEDPYRFALMLTPVCGGLLLLIALCFLRRNKKLQNLLRRFQMTENQRLTSCSTQDLEMQEQTCLPSPYRK